MLPVILIPTTNRIKYNYVMMYVMILQFENVPMALFNVLMLVEINVTI